MKQMQSSEIKKLQIDMSAECQIHDTNVEKRKLLSL